MDGTSIVTSTTERAVTLATSLTLITVIAVSAFLSADSTALYPRQGGEGDPLRRYVLPVFPQSWPFFTKPPTDSELSAYNVNDGEVQVATHFPNSLLSNAMGFSRTQRAQGPELANIAAKVQESEWVTCATTPGDCVLSADEMAAVVVVNSSTFPTFCGELIVAETEPVEWSFRDSYTGWRVDVHAVKVDVDCDQD